MRFACVVGAISLLREERLLTYYYYHKRCIIDRMVCKCSSERTEIISSVSIMRIQCVVGNNFSSERRVLANRASKNGRIDFTGGLSFGEGLAVVRSSELNDVIGSGGAPQLVDTLVIFFNKNRLMRPLLWQLHLGFLVCCSI